MTSLSICQLIEPKRGDDITQEHLQDIISGEQTPLLIAENAAHAWDDVSAQAMTDKFSPNAKISLLVSPTGLVSYYNPHTVKVEIRSGKIWGRIDQAEDPTLDTFELPHLQVDGVLDLQGYRAFMALREQGLRVVDPNELVYLRIWDQGLAVLRPAMAPAIPLDAGIMKQASFYLSQKGNVTTTHVDLYSGIIHQIKGRKRIILFPPQDIDKFSLFPTWHVLARQSMFTEKLTEQSLLDHPALARARGYECVLEANQWIYIPAFWLHHVETLDDDTVSIITRFQR